MNPIKREKYNILAFIIFFLCACTGHAQKASKVIDSLENLLDRHSVQDTVRVDLLNKLGYRYYSRDIEKTIEYSTQAKKLATRLNYKKGVANSLYNFGISKVILSELDPALEQFQNALEIYESTNDISGKIKSFNAIGNTYNYMRAYEKAIIYYEKSINLSKKIDDQNNISNNLNAIASIHSDLGQYSKAVEVYTEALEINKKINNEEGVAIQFLNLGVLYDDQGNLPLALEYYGNSLKIYQKLENNQGISKNLNNMGVVYKKWGNHEKALECYFKSLDINKKQQHKKNIASCLNNIAIIFKEKKKYAKSLDYYKQALAINNEINDKMGLSLCISNMGELYLDKGENALALQNYKKALALKLEIDDKRGVCIVSLSIGEVLYRFKNYKKAIYLAKKSLKIAKKLNLLPQKKEIYDLLSRIYGEVNQYKLAYDSHIKFKEFNDSIFNKENSQKIAQLEYQHKYEKQLSLANKRELTLIKRVATVNQSLVDSQKQKFLFIILFLILTLIMGTIIFISRIRNIRSKNHSIMIEQKLLRSQMNPHFIFNSLSSIQGMILSNKKNIAVNYLNKFSKLMRLILESSDEKLVVLQDEIEAIEHYLELQNMRLESTFDYHISVHENVTVDNLKIPPMIIQPFVENAIEYGFTTIEYKGDLSISIYCEEKNLVCEIIDNGVGVAATIAKKNPSSKKSLSTKIASDRLAIYAKELNGEGNLEINDLGDDNGQGTKVHILIPYSFVL